MPASTQHTPKAWLIGSGIEPLAAAFYIIQQGRIPGQQICILDTRTQGQAEGKECKYLVGDKLFNEESPSLCQDRCLLKLFSEVRGNLWHDDRYASKHCQHYNVHVPHTPAFPTEIFVNVDFRLRLSKQKHHFQPRNQKKIIGFMLQNESNFEGKTIENVFEDYFFDSDIWELFSSNFGLRRVHSAMEFHRHLCEYSDYIQSNNIQSACPLQFISEAPIILNLRAFLKAHGVRFPAGMSVLDIKFFPDTGPRTVCGIQALDNGKPVILPVAEDDIVIIKIGSPISGSISGGSGTPPPRIPVEAEKLLNCDWSLWFRLAKTSSKFGNPSAFCTHISESLLETFTALMPLPDYRMICEQITHAQVQDGHLISIAQSNWSLKIVLPQSQIAKSHQKQTCVLIGYALTPDELGNFVKKPMCVCSGDEIIAELLWQFNIPFDNILERIAVDLHLLPLGLSPLLPRGHEDRPICTPSDTSNIALVGQFVEIAGESTLSLEYGVRSAQVAVNRLLNLGLDLPKVKRSIAITRYGNLSRIDQD